MEDAQSDPRMSRVIAERYGVRSLLVVPLANERDAVGCLYFVFQERPHVFTPAEIDFGRKLGRHPCSFWLIENARLYEEQQRIATTLQESFLRPLPSGRRSRDRHGRAACLCARARRWRLQRRLPARDGQVAILIGDVAGKGVRAAGLTETVRSTVQACRRQSTGRRASCCARQARPCCVASLTEWT